MAGALKFRDEDDEANAQRTMDGNALLLGHFWKKGA
jgi:hypothetical protein